MTPKTNDARSATDINEGEAGRWSAPNGVNAGQMTPEGLNDN
jgi:hypothetical protein